MDVPVIGKAKGLFEIFVPGVFLLLNFVWVLYCIRPKDIDLYKSFSDNEVLTVIILIGLGYLIGVILYLGDADIPDKWSARLRSLGGSKEKYYKDVFPYFSGLESIVNNCFPEYAKSFCRKCWMPRETSCSNSQEETSFRNTYFFNYCKTLINAIDERSALENYSNESLIMYLAAMFYAMVISIILISLVIIYQLVLGEPSDATTYIIKFFSGSDETNITGFLSAIGNTNSSIVDSVVLVIFYFVFLLILLWHYRYMRFKEVQTVFTATLINKQALEKYLKNHDFSIAECDLTGIWVDERGDIFYIRQVENKIAWLEEPKTGNVAVNVATGSITGGKTIKLDWYDVPKGGNRLSGTLDLEILSNNEIAFVSQKGEFDPFKMLTRNTNSS